MPVGQKVEKYCLTLFLCKSTLFQSWQLLCSSRNSILPQRSSRSDSSKMLRAQLFVNLCYCFPHRTQTLSILLLFKMWWTAVYPGFRCWGWRFLITLADLCLWRLLFHRGCHQVAFIASVDLHTQRQQGKQRDDRKYEGTRWHAMHKHTHGCQPTSLSAPLHHFTCTPTTHDSVSQQQAS